MAKALGIDLGTTNTVVATLENGRPRVLPNVEGGLLTPSVVAFTRDAKRLAGGLAKRQAVANPERTVTSIKRQMGSAYKVEMDHREYTPQEISSLILQKVRKDAEDYLGEEIKKAVITVPAYFNNRQRQATQEAGRIAGLEVMRILNEPTAAALAYGLDMEDIHTILVWDLGGGTFDVSILELGGGVFEVKAVNGNNWLGGDDWDQRIVEFMLDEFQKEHGIDLGKDRTALQRIKEAAEGAKIELSSKYYTTIHLPFGFDHRFGQQQDESSEQPHVGATRRVAPTTDGRKENHGLPFIIKNYHGSKELKTQLTRSKFEELTADLTQKLAGPTEQALADAGLKVQDIHRVILVGGATRMPAVQRLARTLLGQDPYRDIDPDKVVAIGAAIQAGILEGEIGGITLLDVIPLSLGIETQGGVFAKIIQRNTKIPTSKGQIFTTAADHQTEVDIDILQGEREMALYNLSLGRFQLTGIPPAPRGRPQIEVTFEVDANGILQVSATDLRTDHEQRITISSSNRLSRQEMEGMIQEADRYAAEDQKRREEVEMGIQADHRSKMEDL